MGDEPPPWLLPLGAGGVATGFVGHTIGGPIGALCADLGCATTALAAFAFFGLLFEWLYPRKPNDED